MAGEIKEREEIRAIVKELDRTFNSALYDIGFLEGTIGNELVGKKIVGSFSGHALDVAIRAVIQKSLLYVTRSWDNNGDSIPRLLRSLDGWGDRLEKERKGRRPDFPDDFLEIGAVEEKIQQLKRDAEIFLKKPEFLAAKLHRDEHVAHLLKGKSGFGQKLKSLGQNIEPATYDQVIVLARETAGFVSRILQICEFTVKNPSDWIENSKNQTQKFWQLLPILSDAEETEQS